MKFKKVITMGIAAVMAVSAMSISAFAESNGDEIVYSYIDENNNEVNLTQADLDAEHWDKDALGDTAPFIYEDFPMHVDSFVNDYSDLSLKLNYLKNIENAESLSLKVTDLNANQVIYESNITKPDISINNIEMNKAYKLSLSETFDGITKEYYKAVTTSLEEAEMPEYVKDPETTDETIILVADVDNLRASTIINDDGSTEILSDMPRYEQVKACDFSEYINNLPNDKLFRIYTRDDSYNQYFGFISTSGNIDGIFMPSITVYKWDTFNAPTAYSTTLPRKLTSSQVLNGTTTEIDKYRDYSFWFSSEEREFEVFKFKVPEDSYDEPFNITVHANDSITMEIWTQQPGANTLTYEWNEWDRNGYIESETLMEFAHGAIEDGGYVYFALYFNGTVSSGEGTISIQKTNTNDDVTGSAYQAHEEWENGNYTQYKKWTPFYITDDRDVDVFFLNCGTSSVTNYVRVNKVAYEDRANYNNKYTKRSKYIELAYIPANATFFRTSSPPSDIMTLDKDSDTYISFSRTSTTSNKRFIYIYNVDGTNSASNDIYLLKRYNR